jgi:hypothetical protein
VAVAIKTARELALLPYTQRTVSERGPGRGPRGGPGGPPREPRRSRDDDVVADDDDAVLEVDLAAVAADVEVEDAE